MGVVRVEVVYSDLLAVDPVRWEIGYGPAGLTSARRGRRNALPMQILAPSLLLPCSG